MQTIHLNCIEDKSFITKTMVWKCTFCLFTFPFSSCLGKKIAEFINLDIFNLFFLLQWSK